MNNCSATLHLQMHPKTLDRRWTFKSNFLRKGIFSRQENKEQMHAHSAADIIACEIQKINSETQRPATEHGQVVQIFPSKQMAVPKHCESWAASQPNRWTWNPKVSTEKEEEVKTLQPQPISILPNTRALVWFQKKHYTLWETLGIIPRLPNIIFRLHHRNRK